MRPLTPPDFLVACVGNHIETRSAEAMKRTCEILTQWSIRFVDADWLSSNEVAAATLCWIVDAQAPVDAVQKVSRDRMPVLVPVERQDLLTMFGDQSRVFSYGTAAEATERIVSILQKAKAVGR